METMDGKLNPCCMMCNVKVGLGSRNAVDIFNAKNKLPCSNKTLDVCLKEITRRPIEPATCHSHIICRKCYKLVEKYDLKMSRVESAKKEILEQFGSALGQPTATDDDEYLHEMSEEPGGSAPPRILANKSSHKQQHSKEDWSRMPDLKNIAPLPSNLVIVGPKGKKLKLQNAPQPQVPVEIKVDTPKKKSINLEGKVIDSDPATGKIVYCQYEAPQAADEETPTYFDETEVEIVDDEISGIALEEGSIFMEQAEDGSIIRVISSSNIIQDEHGNYIYNPEENSGIQMILQDDGKESVLHYKDIASKEGPSFLMPTNPIKEEPEDENNFVLDDDGLQEALHFEDGADVSSIASLEAQTAAYKVADDCYICLVCTSNDSNPAELEESEARFEDEQLMLEHMDHVHSTNVFICDHCGDAFLYKEFLEEHMEEHFRTSSGDFPCEFCGSSFDCEELRKQHRRILHWRLKPRSCKICGKTFADKGDLEHHLKIHKWIKSYTCCVCKKTFSSKYTRNIHLRTHTNRSREHICPVCGRGFYTPANLKAHERTHTGVKSFLCKQCGKTFLTNANLEAHFLVHSGFKPYPCETCGKSFARRSELRDHVRIHTGERPFACEFCDLRFAQRSNLQSHKRATHFDDKRYKCSQCDKCFKRQRLLDYHMMAVHTGERPYRCLVCDAAFVYPGHFKKHERIHVEQYMCEICGKTFKSLATRNNHRQMHDKKPYECSDCGAGFMKKPLLYAHNAKGHLKEEEELQEQE